MKNVNKIRKNPRFVKLLQKRQFDCYCVPTKQQHDFCLINYDLFKNPALQYAANIVISAYQFSDEVHLDFILIVNDFMRKF